MSEIALRNPGLPSDQWIHVSKQSQAHYARSGWQPVPEEEVAARAQAEADQRVQALAAMAAPPTDPDGDQAPVDTAPPGPEPEPEPESTAAVPADEAATEAAPEPPAADAPKKRSPR